jgi:TldD protein
MFDSLERCLQTSLASQANLVELRGQSRDMTLCTVRNGVVEDLAHVSLKGMDARVFVDGKSWGFSSTNMLDHESAKQTLQNAVGLASASTQRQKRELRLRPVKSVAVDESAPVKKRPCDLSAEDIVEFPLGASKGAREVDAQVAEAKATYISLEDEKYYVNSEGSHIHQSITRVLLFIDVMAKSGGRICPASETLGHTGGLELFDETTPYAVGKAVAEIAVGLLTAQPPPSGKFRVVIHPTLCATLLHEAIGHPLEADLAMAGGGFGNRVGELVSSERVTIFDDGRVAGGLGYFPYDDEGVECQRTVLIEKGVLKSFLHDRASAAVAGVSPTGNAHAWDYSVEPLIRQTNIGLEAGDYAVPELIEDIKDGFLLKGTFGGQANVNADFTFGFQRAQRIHQGELREMMQGANVAGNAIDVFKTVDAVGRDVVLRPGACGKFQFAVQGRVVPAIRCEIMVGGRGGP